MNKILYFFNFAFLLSFFTANGQKYEKIVAQDSTFTVILKGDSSQMGRIQVFVKYLIDKTSTSGRADEIEKHDNVGAMDTLSDNTNPMYAPVWFQYACIYQSKYICLITNTDASHDYWLFQWEGKWVYQDHETLDWRDYRFSTTFKVRDCFHIEMSNGVGEFMWTVEPETKRFTKTEIAKEKH